MVVVVSDTLAEAKPDMRTRLCINDIPEFVLTTAAVTLLSECVVGVHLNREAVACVDKLHQHGKLQAETLIDALTDKLAHIDLNNLLQVIVFQKTIGDDGLFALHPRDFPTLTNALLVLRLLSTLASGSQLATTPNALFQSWTKLNRV